MPGVPSPLILPHLLSWRRVDEPCMSAMAAQCRRGATSKVWASRPATVRSDPVSLAQNRAHHFVVGGNGRALALPHRCRCALSIVLETSVPRSDRSQPARQELRSCSRRQTDSQTQACMIACVPFADRVSFDPPPSGTGCTRPQVHAALAPAHGAGWGLRASQFMACVMHTTPRVRRRPRARAGASRLSGSAGTAPAPDLAHP